MKSSEPEGRLNPGFLRAGLAPRLGPDPQKCPKPGTRFLILNPEHPEICGATRHLAGGPLACCNGFVWTYVCSEVSPEGEVIHHFIHPCHPEDLKVRLKEVAADPQWTIRRWMHLDSLALAKTPAPNKNGSRGRFAPNRM